MTILESVLLKTLGFHEFLNFFFFTPSVGLTLTTLRSRVLHSVDLREPGTPCESLLIPEMRSEANVFPPAFPSFFLLNA